MDDKVVTLGEIFDNNDKLIDEISKFKDKISDKKKSIILRLLPQKLINDSEKVYSFLPEEVYLNEIDEGFLNNKYRTLAYKDTEGINHPYNYNCMDDVILNIRIIHERDNIKVEELKEINFDILKRFSVECIISEGKSITSIKSIDNIKKFDDKAIVYIPLNGIKSLAVEKFKKYII